MNLIVFDLEWNQSPSGKRHEIEGLPFEIIEIGAVKLNEEKEIIDAFHVLIKPVAYRRMHPIIGNVIPLTMRELNKKGIPFEEAAQQFLSWCGEDYRFCTWGTLDLLELQRNLKWFGMEELLKGPILYEDVQKLFALTYEPETPKERRALIWAVEYLKLPEDRRFHLAIDDAYYTAGVLRAIPDEIIFKNYSIDTYQNPKNRKEEIYLRFETYEKYISKEFDSKEKLMADRIATSVRCFCCNHNTRRVIRWFPSGSKNYLSVGKCAEHGYVKSKIRIKKTEQNRFYAVKTTKMIDSDGVERVRQKRRKLREKQKLKKLKSEVN